MWQNDVSDWAFVYSLFRLIGGRGDLHVELHRIMTMLILDDMSLQSLAQFVNRQCTCVSTLICACTVPSRRSNIPTDPVPQRIIFAFARQTRVHLKDIHTWMLCSISMPDCCVENFNSFRSWCVSTASMLAARSLCSCTLYGRRSAHDCSHWN